MDIQTAALVAGTAGVSSIMLLSALAMWFYERRGRQQRVQSVVGRRSNRTASASAGPRNSVLQRGIVAFMRLSTRRFSIIKERQVKETKLMLVSAGYRSRDAIVVYSFFKLVAPVATLVAAGLYVYGLDPIGRGQMADAAAVVLAALIGSKLPDFIVKNGRKKRLETIRKALPDSLDMLVICAEAGLASDAALKRVVAETGRRSSVLSEELNQTALELSFMPERRQALENFAARAPVPSVVAFTNTLIQAEKYGTPLARAFKVLAQEQRNERMMRAEEKAGRLPAIMTVPMMLFILPALFIVLIGPAVLDIMDNFIGM
jgi:tight adherence protein C